MRRSKRCRCSNPSTTTSPPTRRAPVRIAPTQSSINSCTAERSRRGPCPPDNRSPRMQRTGERLLFSPSDLNHFLECEHLIQLQRRDDARELARPRDEQTDLLARKGLEH